MQAHASSKTGRRSSVGGNHRRILPHLTPQFPRTGAGQRQGDPARGRVTSCWRRGLILFYFFLFMVLRDRFVCRGVMKFQSINQSIVSLPVKQAPTNFKQNTRTYRRLVMES